MWMEIINEQPGDAGERGRQAFSHVNAIFKCLYEIFKG